MEDKLSAYLSKSREWKRRPTNVSGLFLLKLPSSRSRQASIAIEINPVDATGVATNNRGTVVRSASELHQFNNILADQYASNELTSMATSNLSSYYVENLQQNI